MNNKPNNPQDNVPKEGDYINPILRDLKLFNYECKYGDSEHNWAILKIDLLDNSVLIQELTRDAEMLWVHIDQIEPSHSRIAELEAELNGANRKVSFYRGEVGKIRDFVFDESNKTGLPCQSIFEAIDDKIKALQAENQKYREALDRIAECRNKDMKYIHPIMLVKIAEQALKTKDK